MAASELYGSDFARELADIRADRHPLASLGTVARDRLP
jgi:hypothetical protein